MADVWIDGFLSVCLSFRVPQILRRAGVGTKVTVTPTATTTWTGGSTASSCSTQCGESRTTPQDIAQPPARYVTVYAACMLRSTRTIGAR